MSMTHSSLGLRLDAPSPGDVVTVRVRRRPKQENQSPFGGGLLSMVGRDSDEADNAQHYRMNDIWRVVAVNGAQAVVESARPGSYNFGKREVWSVAHHEWFEASELLAALLPAQTADREA